MRFVAVVVAVVACAFVILRAAGPERTEDRLARFRNLGKAFYENPTTQNEAVEEFRKALALAPNSARERLNYGLALLRAGKTPAAIAELLKVQKQDPSIPHTWFNLGIAYKKAGDQEKAIGQFEQMIKLVPDEPISRYNLGAMYRMAGRNEEAIREFRTAAKLDPTLAAPHFQLFNLLRTSSRAEEAKPELETFQRLKKQQEGAAIPEDVEWSMYAEIYDVMADTSSRDIPADLKFEARNGPALPSGVPGDSNNDGRIDYCDKQTYAACLWIDYDHDYDLDLILLGPKSALMRNQGPSENQPASFPFVQGDALSGVAFRMVPDTKGFDLLVTYADRDAVLYRDRLQGRYEPENVRIPPGSKNVAAGDFNNDGWLDLIYTAANGTYIAWNKKGVFAQGQLLTPVQTPFVFADLENRGALDIVFGSSVLRSDRNGAFTTTKANLPPECSAWTARDLDNDGRVDLVCGTKQFLNRTTSANSWIGVNLQGVRNLKLAFGSEVEVKAGPRYQKKLYEGIPLIFGLGSEKQADTVRITWPNGLIQNEIRQAAGKVYKYVEAQRLSGSCPIVWTWNGHEFEYITDVLGVAPLGASSGDGQYFPVDHDEYIQIPAKSLVAADGGYRIRITEELSEVAYIDQVKLIAVDHPADMAIYTNDKFKAPPFPEFRLYGVRKEIPPKSATTSDGKNVLSSVLAKDGVYPDDFSRNMSGVANLHHLDLDFGSRAGSSILVLNGWVDWADGSTFLGVAQQTTSGLVLPYLQVKDQHGNWQTVVEDMGMPAGKPKTIAVDLTGKWLSESREVRIATNLCVYWDQIFLSENTSHPDIRMTEASLQSSDLRFRGFSPAFIHPERKQPERFTYADAKPVSFWNPTPGFYTRYGDVHALTAEVDDKMIVMGSGDEIRLRFKELPPAPTGWARDFLLRVDGWAKDRDANTAHGQSTSPLPFHAMSRFPYPAGEEFPADEDHKAYVRDYNTRPALRLIRPLR